MKAFREGPGSWGKDFRDGPRVGEGCTRVWGNRF